MSERSERTIHDSEGPTPPVAEAGTLEETERVEAGPGHGRGPFGGGMVAQKA